MAAFADAQTLAGFDGSNYWDMTLDFPQRVYLKTGEDKELFPPVSEANMLTIVPGDEPSRDQGRYRLDVALRVITALAAECRRVVQFGCGKLLSGPPQIAENNLTLDEAASARLVTVRVAGNINRPSGLSYESPPALRVSLLYDQDTIQIEMLSLQATNVVSRTRYHLLAVSSTDDSLGDSMFSWRKYRPSEGELQAEVVRDGARHMGLVKDNGEVAAGRMLVPATPISGGRSVWLIVALVLIALLGAAAFLRSSKHAAG